MRIPADPLKVPERPPLCVTQVKMSRELHDAARALADKKGTTLSALVRGLLAEFVREAR